jgi:hypothetical protein
LMAIDLKNNKNNSENVHILSLEIQWNWPVFQGRTDLFSFCGVIIFSVLPNPYIAWKQHPFRWMVEPNPTKAFILIQATVLTMATGQTESSCSSKWGISNSFYALFLVLLLKITGLFCTHITLDSFANL